MSSSDDQRRNDLDWLYGDQRPTPDPGESARQRPQGPVPSSYGRAPGSPALGQQPPASAARADVQAATPAPAAGASPRPPAPQSGSGSPPNGGFGGRPPMGPPPQAPKPPRPPRSGRKRHPFRWILALVALYLAYLVAVPLWFLLAGNQFDATPSGERPPEQPGTTLLLVGSDAKKDDTAGSRTDSIMVLYVPTTGKPVLLSLPRDSYVPIPGHGKNKINAAYAFGGPTLLVQTVEQNTGLRMDGVIEVSMAGFPALVDAVGGIELCLDKPMKDKDSKADFPAGCQQFDGAKALAYTRMRKADPLGDLGRIKRQREVIGKVVGQALSPSSLLPWQWWSLWEAGTSVVQRSSDTSLATLARSGMALGKLGSGGMLQGTVPVSNTNASTPAGSSVLWDNAKAKQLFAQLATGDTTGVEQYLK